MAATLANSGVCPITGTKVGSASGSNGFNVIIVTGIWSQYSL